MATGITSRARRTAPEARRESGRATSGASHPGDCNLAVVCGALSAPPTVRRLPSGTELVTLAVRTMTASGALLVSTSVPVTWWHAPASSHAWEEGTRVVVVGLVRRRFFRGAGGLGSATEIEAFSVRRATPAQQEAAWRRARDLLDALVT